MLELKHNGVLIQTIREGGWFTLPNGDHVSPAMAGWSNEAGYALSEAPAPEPPTEEERRATWRASREIPRLAMGDALEAAGILTAEETDDFVSYVLPAPILGLIATLPEEYQAAARRKMKGAQDFPRADPFWDIFAAIPGGMTAEQIDAVFGWPG